MGIMGKYIKVSLRINVNLFSLLSFRLIHEVQAGREMGKVRYLCSAYRKVVAEN